MTVAHDHEPPPPFEQVRLQGGPDDGLHLDVPTSQRTITNWHNAEPVLVVASLLVSELVRKGARQ